MAALRLRLFGRPTVQRADASTVAVPASLQPLLGYLSLEPATHHHRELVVEALWPGQPAQVGSKRLNTAVWRARSLFDAGRDEVLQVSRGGTIALDRERISIDVVEAAAGLRGGYPSEDAVARSARIDAHDLLVGCYDEWVVRAREELASRVVSLLERLVEETQDPATAIGWAELLVRRDPLREDVHRRLMRLYADAGRRADALHQYDVCAHVLWEDLGVEPLVETSLLAAAVRERVAPLAPEVVDPVVALQELRGALASCRSAVEQIERALTSLPRG
jgi:DNA-binding SARP family transcriptional activator